MAPAKKSDPVYSGWVPHHAGYELTKSEHIIRHTIKWLREKRIFIILVHKEYQSGGTLIVDHSNSEITIDRPRDWPGKLTNLRVAFRNSANLWCHFSVKLTGRTRHTLQFLFPTALYMLQRRSNFRINLPDGSSASFVYNKKKCKLNVKDLSASGMLVCDRVDEHMPEKGHTLQHINLVIPSENQSEAPLRFKIKEGEVVRSFVYDRTPVLCLGVQFLPSGPEEERIMKYIRQRELAMLRKGIQE